MKILTPFLLLCILSIANAQSLPINFEGTISTADFEDFDGGTATILANPQANGINTSPTVAQIVREGGTIWAGSKITLAENLDFSNLNTLSMKVFTSAPVGTIIKFKLEGAGETERDAQTTVTNEWETLTWDFTGTPANFNELVFMFDYGNVGDGSQNSTFFFDDIEQLFGGFQIDLPVTFEEQAINYTLSDFNGNQSTLISDPTDASNTVAQVIKTAQAEATAGTTIGTSAGFASNIPLSLSYATITIKIWSPDAGIPIRLKIENANDPTQTCETETMTSVAGSWETLSFDFTNEAPGTAALNVGLSMGWTYNMASIFFNFGTDGASAGETTYYFDDVQFDEMVGITPSEEIQSLSTYPNPTTDQWIVATENNTIASIQLFDVSGKLLLILSPNNTTATIDASNLATGIYVARVSTTTGQFNLLKLLKE